MNLLLLSPEIQEELLFLPRIEQGRDPVYLRQLQAVAAVPDWTKQRALWRVVDRLCDNEMNSRFASCLIEIVSIP